MMVSVCEVNIKAYKLCRIVKKAFGKRILCVIFVSSSACV
jgi:hypothetical protein